MEKDSNGVLKESLIASIHSIQARNSDSFSSDEVEGKCSELDGTTTSGTIERSYKGILKN